MLSLVMAPAFWMKAVAKSQDEAANHTVRVFSSIKPLSLVANALLRDLPEDAVRVSTLLQGQASPHHYSLNVSSALDIQDADLLLWVGEDFERFLIKPIARRKNISLAMRDTADELQQSQATWGDERGHHHDHDHDQDKTSAHHADLHLWLDPHRVISYAENLVVELKRLLPLYEVQIEANMLVFRQQIHKTEKAIFAYFRQQTPSHYLVFHDAYGHFAGFFNLPEPLALTLVPDQMLSAKQLLLLRKQAQGAACLLVERGNEAKGQAFANKLKLPVVEVDILAIEPAVTGYDDLLWSVANSFAACWQ